MQKWRLCYLWPLLGLHSSINPVTGTVEEALLVLLDMPAKLWRKHYVYGGECFRGCWPEKVPFSKVDENFPQVALLKKELQVLSVSLCIYMYTPYITFYYQFKILCSFMWPGELKDCVCVGGGGGVVCIMPDRSFYLGYSGLRHLKY